MNFFRAVLSFLVMAAFLLCGVSSYAQPQQQAWVPSWIYQDIVKAPTGYKIGPREYNRTLLTPGTPGTSDWMIAQWGNAFPLTAFNGAYTKSSLSSRVTFTPANNLTELALNGDRLACDVEANLFASPTMNDAYDTPPFVPMIRGSLAENGKQLYMQLNVKPKYIKQVPSSCLTQGSFILSFVMKNDADIYKTVFYQLIVHNADVVPVRAATKFWFFNDPATNTWGYDDVLSSYGLTQPKVGQTLSFAKDVKPRLRQVIADPANTLPSHMRNPDGWYVSSVYYGPHVWGGLLTTYEASNFRLAERWMSTCNPDIC